MGSEYKKFLHNIFIKLQTSMKTLFDQNKLPKLFLFTYLVCNNPSE